MYSYINYYQLNLTCLHIIFIIDFVQYYSITGLCKQQQRATQQQENTSESLCYVHAGDI